ncbi:hypothetical protein [Methylosinus sp. Sm6]|uniref:hypothetical protein n=1 Tax=Methylosinus sp. Sm6 TaxID=2866948 RepID=UPI001C99EB9F|nr:hypothetical protein [Methylosinus sp. Sm6]MBY6243199.1 hypothetical protein [Methylosinus sp. Sm6]
MRQTLLQKHHGAEFIRASSTIVLPRPSGVVYIFVMRQGSSGTLAWARVLVTLCVLVGLTPSLYRAHHSARAAAADATAFSLCESFHGSTNEEGGRSDFECCIFCRVDAHGDAFVSGSALGAVLFILHPEADRAWPEHKRAPPPTRVDGSLTTWSATAPPASFA